MMPAVFVRVFLTQLSLSKYRPSLFQSRLFSFLNQLFTNFFTARFLAISRKNLTSRESLSTRIFETRTATGKEHFECQDSLVSQIFILLISNGENTLRNVNVVVRGQVKSENSSLPVAVRVSKTLVLKLPNMQQFTERIKTIQNLCTSVTCSQKHELIIYWRQYFKILNALTFLNTIILLIK